MGRPRSFQPSKGVLRALLRNLRRSDRHRATRVEQGQITRSALSQSPTGQVQYPWKSSTNRDKLMIPGRTSLS